MKSKQRFILLGLLLLLFALPATAFAQGDSGDQVVFGGSYTLSAGETLSGDLVVFGGSVNLETDSNVLGDIVLIGGSIEVGGEVTGDVIVIGGFVDLSETALIQGDLVTPGGSVRRAEGSQVRGQVVTNVDIPWDITIPRVFTPGVITPRVNVNYNPVWEVIWFLFRTVMIAALAVFLILFFPQQAERSSRAVVQQPILAGGLGLLTLIVAVPVLILLIITIILIPVSFLGLLLLLLAMVFGWITLGLEVGNRLAELFNRQWPAALAAGVGTFALALVALSIGEIPCVGWTVPFLVTAIGLGGVLLTRFGTQDYPPMGAVAPAAPPLPAPEAEADPEVESDPDAAAEQE